jgi:hypothetical protein
VGRCRARRCRRGGGCGANAGADPDEAYEDQTCQAGVALAGIVNNSRALVRVPRDTVERWGPRSGRGQPRPTPETMLMAGTTRNEDPPGTARGPGTSASS